MEVAELEAVEVRLALPVVLADDVSVVAVIVAVVDSVDDTEELAVALSVEEPEELCVDDAVEETVDIFAPHTSNLSASNSMTAKLS